MLRQLLPRPSAHPFSAHRAAALAAVLLLGGALGGCAMQGKPPAAGSAVRELPAATGSAVVAAWQARLGQHVASAGGGDPAALSQLPALRSPAVARPGQIIFAATDVEAFVPERDGYDVSGLLLGKQGTASRPRYVFIVGTVERRDYWPVAVVDIRVAAMTMNNGAASWETGPANAEALARYRQNAGPSPTAVRFPAELDQFRLVGCEPGVCVEELRSGARWALYPEAPAAR